ncbi:MAG: hypothetical protein ISR91_00690 [Candidatus Delongbacteria bacterium]|nr:hypothetical protein [bacterium]MBL7032639.1 hypothetical protein [Candidatus Delongbacteria bacterium]
MQLHPQGNGIAELRGKLRQGKILSALVEGCDEKGRWLLTLAGVTLPFESREPLQQGERIMLLVERLHPNMVLKRVGTLRDGGFDGRL